MSSDETANLTIRILREIRDQARATNERLDATNERLDRLTHVVVHGFQEVNGRIDNLLLGKHREEHEDLRRRMGRIEEQLGLDPM